MLTSSRSRVLLHLLLALLLAVVAVAAASPPAVAQEDSDEPDQEDSDPAAGEDEDDDSEPGEGPPPTEEDLEEYDALAPDGAWRESVRLQQVPSAHDGGGVTVAILDTGLLRHPDLGGRVPVRVDLTPDSDAHDRYGHGTHMAGVVAGDGSASEGRWAGAAPRASVVPVKVAGWNGATDVSSVVAGLEWIAANRERYGIRVVNLSYGTDSVAPVSRDPLNHAVQRLWRAGVLVVVGAGNRGTSGLDKPGDDPYVVTVGAADTRGTASTADDVVAPFSGRPSSGSGKPDLLAPGVSIVSHRPNNTTVDVLRPAARLDEQYFKGTGTSQAAAVVSGIAARMFDAAPQATPDEVKAALVRTADQTLAGRPGAGAGLVDAAGAVGAAQSRRFAADPANQGLRPSAGTGSLDDSRGSFHPWTDFRKAGTPEPLVGEVTALGTDWNADAWASGTWSDATYAASPWAKHTALAQGWGTATRSAAWSGLGWDQGSWTARSWGDAGIGPNTGWVARSWGSALWNGLG